MEFVDNWAAFFSELLNAMAIMALLTTLWLAHTAALWSRRAKRTRSESAEHITPCGARRRCGCRCACEASTYDADHSRATADPV